jgi:hypothetical protein
LAQHPFAVSHQGATFFLHLPASRPFDASDGSDELEVKYTLTGSDILLAFIYVNIYDIFLAPSECTVSAHPLNEHCEIK